MLIIGAGGLAIQMIELIEGSVQDHSTICFYDDTAAAADSFFSGYPILHNERDAAKHFDNVGSHFCIAVSAPSQRESFWQKFILLGGTPVSLISSGTSIGKYMQRMEEGVVILGGGIIESCTSIGRGSLLNVHVAVTHNSTIGAFCELGPGVIVCGHCSISDRCFIGAGAVILPHISIGEGSTIAAGAVVTKDVKPGETVMGVPGKAQ